VLQQPDLVCLNWYILSYASRLFLWHHVQHPTAVMDIGGGPNTPKMWILALNANLRNQISIHIFRRRLLHPWLENLSYNLYLFVSSNWVVINHKKGEIISAIKTYCEFWCWWPPN
jgi:hypothetical protein